ncbi:MAG TPA: hypothetical protein VJA94_10865 [Candidatus Angelobacter sp.]
MGLRQIYKRLRKIGWRLPIGTDNDVPNPNQVFESGNGVTACNCEQGNGLERRFDVPVAVNGQGEASSASLQPKTRIGADAITRAKKDFCADDIARGILGRNSGVTIRNVLVVGTNGSTPLKRMEIHFEGPEQVPAFFNSLATALKSSGAQFHAVWTASIPAAEIWLTYPVNDGKRTLLSCGGLIGEQVAPRTAAEAGSPQEYTE